MDFAFGFLVIGNLYLGLNDFIRLNLCHAAQEVFFNEGLVGLSNLLPRDVRSGRVKKPSFEMFSGLYLPTAKRFKESGLPQKSSTSIP